ncbi:hypothetical protein [Shewanella woodyi]|uniref:Lipoprotein n=1 Tax=Shewanella woodyi (strain ATCC 51908 / MS32) TaxID=392500 RepID=B1KJ38_SHEWM|nr:hypothetical protein [Shewanella woodyi]ACA87058.1 hypothetical protein Swoo_2782 [Shewanella woodyi ATCC 51908]
MKKLSLVCCLLFLTACSANNVNKNNDTYNNTDLDSLVLPSHYTSPCFRKNKKIYNEFSTLLGRLEIGELSQSDAASKMVVLCPHQPEMIIWLTNTFAKPPAYL